MQFERVQGKRILITGGAGFIGANLCEDFALDNEVIAFDNLSTGKRANLDLAIQRGTQFIAGDIRDPKALSEVMDGVDYVLHQAALGSVPRSIDNPLATHEVNTTGWIQVFLAAKESGVRRMVYASSSSVYGDHPALPKEEEKIGDPLSPYAVSKQAGEKYAVAFAKVYGKPELIGLRYFNVFGKYQNPDGAYAAAIPKFIKAFIQHESPQVHGDGTQSRDFTYVKNVIQANHCALLCPSPQGQQRVYNVACHQRYTLNELLEILKDLLKEKDPAVASVPIQYGPPRPGDVPHSLASINRAKQELSYAPQYGLKEGLEESINWYWKHLKGSPFEEGAPFNFSEMLAKQ